MTVNRRQLLIGSAGAVLGLSAAAGEAAAAPAGFPDYRYLRLALVKSKLRYNPTNELIFPTIRGTKDRIPGARAAYYLYYAPHDAPGGLPAHDVLDVVARAPEHGQAQLQPLEKALPAPPQPAHEEHDAGGQCAAHDR